MTRVVLRPFVRERVAQCVRAGRGVRIVDLGCGAGQGYEQLIRIDQRDLDLADEQSRPMFIETSVTQVGCEMMSCGSVHQR
jgi:2-polyprenyl-3-methyl-5-hydroxy-6-metoxy-1,4-benzoquinol methylase